MGKGAQEKEKGKKICYLAEDKIIWTKKKSVLQNRKHWLPWKGGDTGHKPHFPILFYKPSFGISFKWNVQLDDFWCHLNLTVSHTEESGAMCCHWFSWIKLFLSNSATC